MIIRTLALTALAVIAVILVSCVSAQQRWETARSIDSTEAYRKVQKTYPGTEYSRKAAEQISKIRAERDWTAAEETETIAGYEEFIQNHPTSEYASRARERIAEIHERIDWQHAKEKDEESFYEAFLDRYADSAHADEARANVSRLRALPHWERAQKIDTIGAYEEFLNAYPNSDFTDQARNRIKTLKASDDWKWTRDRDTIKAYQLFVEKHPDSEFSTEARKRISALIDERAKQLEDARRKRERDEDKRKRAVLRKLRAVVESDCKFIDEFTAKVKGIKELYADQLVELGIKLEPAWERYRYPEPLQDLLERIDKAFSYFDKLIEATDGPRVYSLRWSLDAPPGPLCRIVANELQRGNHDEYVVAAFNEYRDKIKKNIKCFEQVMDELNDKYGSFGYLNECRHLE